MIDLSTGTWSAVRKDLLGKQAEKTPKHFIGIYGIGQPGLKLTDTNTERLFTHKDQCGLNRVITDQVVSFQR